MLLNLSESNAFVRVYQGKHSLPSNAHACNQLRDYNLESNILLSKNKT